MTKRGRPTNYSQELADEICRRIGDGESLRSICAETGMPGRTTVFRWLADPDRDDFRHQYAHARDAQADAIFDDMLEIADDAMNDWMQKRLRDGQVETVVDQEHIQRTRLRIDTRKWIAARLAPKKYGDKVDVGVSGGLTVALEEGALPAALGFLREHGAGGEGRSDGDAGEVGEA